jgi:hypothetical protein
MADEQELPEVCLEERVDHVRHIEWTGAGGDYFLAVVIDERREVVAERWGTRREVNAWMQTEHGDLPRQYVPMALGATRRHRKKPPDGTVPHRKIV